MFFRAFSLFSFSFSNAFHIFSHSLFRLPPSPPLPHRQQALTTAAIPQFNIVALHALHLDISGNSHSHTLTLTNTHTHKHTNTDSDQMMQIQFNPSQSINSKSQSSIDFLFMQKLVGRVLCGYDIFLYRVCKSTKLVGKSSVFSPSTLSFTSRSC
jgi:hypothetical protein